MQFLGPVTWPEVVFEWLSSEQHKLPGGAQVGDLLVKRDLDDAERNRQREALLRINHREPVINGLPTGSARWVRIEESDLSDMCVIPDPSWYPNTAGTFRLVDTAENLRPGRGSLVLPLIGPIGTYDAVREKSRYIHGYDAETTSEALILVASDDNGPYTIIDGTHRAAALYLDHAKNMNMPWKGILFSDPSIAGYRWHIGSLEAKLNIFQQGIYASHGLLW